MKGARIVLTVAIPAIFVAPAAAQPPVRPDLSASIGWLNVNKSTPVNSNDWYNRGVQGAAAFGWYWTPHLKTEIEPSASTRVNFNDAHEEIVNGQRAYVLSEFGFSTRRIALSQQYQFGENAWFHPHLAAGLDFNWETTARNDRSIYFLDPLPRQAPIVPQNIHYPTQTDLHVRPLVGAGFKAYVTPRAFLRSDVRLLFSDRLEEALLRFGFGVDF
jgi:hypothetical protein